MKRTSLWIAMVLILAASPAWARQADQVHEGTIEIAGFSGALMQRQTFEDPDFPEGNFNASSATIGADVAYYISERLGVGIYLTRQSFGQGPSSARFEISGTLVGPQVKYRVPMSDNLSVAVSAAGGVAATNVSFSGSDVDDFETVDNSTDGKFVLGGVTLNFFLAERVSADVGLQYQFTRVTSGPSGAEAKLNASGFLGGFGFSIFLN